MPNDKYGKDPPTKERAMEQQERQKAAQEKVAPETEPKMEYPRRD